MPKGSRCDGPLEVVDKLVSNRACGKATESTRQLWKAAVNDDNGSSCCMCGRAGGVCLGGQSSDVSWVVTSASAAMCPSQL